MGCTRRLKFDTQTTHRLLAEFRGLRVRMTHVTRRTRTKIFFLNPKFFRPKIFFRDKIFFSNPKFCFDPNFFRTKFFFRLKIFFQTQFFFRLKIFFQTQKNFWNFFFVLQIFFRSKIFFGHRIFDLETSTRDWGTFQHFSLVKT